MKKNILITMLMIALTLCGCASQGKEDAKTSYKRISAEQAKDMMGEKDNYIILDVRTAGEYDGGHIKDAVLLPLDQVSDKAEDVLKDKEQLVFVYCRSGNRSATAAKELASMGYTNIYDMGGIMSWPYEVVK